MNYKIWTINDKKEESFLRKPTKSVVDVNDQKISNLIMKMHGTMKNNKGVGLAANQIGEDVKICVIDHDDVFYALINPEIIKKSKKMLLAEEGCLSVPNVLGLVNRHYKISVKALDGHGKQIKIKATNTLAQIFQHEIDHLNGILFIDRAEKLFKVKDGNVVSELKQLTPSS